MAFAPLKVKGERDPFGRWQVPGTPDGAAIHHYLGKMSIQEKTKSFWEEGILASLR